MASIGHVIVGMAAGRRLAEGAGRGPRWAWMAGLSALSLLPDADVAAFALGIPYEHPFGHRGASHAVVVGLVVGVGLAVLARSLAPRLPLRSLAATFAIVLVSHGLLDALTDGGLGPALLWPFSDERMFAPWRPLPVAPIGHRFFTARGLAVATTELVWFLPLLVVALWPGRRPAAAASQPADG